MKSLAKLMLISLISIFLLSGCESDEMDDIAKAQDCLDKAVSTDALNCVHFVAKYDSQKANIIKCSAYFMSGGLTTQKIADAYKELVQNGGTDKEALFISTLTLEAGPYDSPPTANDPAAALLIAQKADAFCQRTAVKGLIYLSSLSVIGSSLALAVPGGVGFTTFPPDQTELDNTLAACEASPSSCNVTGITSAAELIADSYCVGSNADTDVCKKIDTALADPDQAGEALMCLMDNKTWDGTTCN